MSRAEDVTSGSVRQIDPLGGMGDVMYELGYLSETVAGNMKRGCLLGALPRIDQCVVWVIGHWVYKRGALGLLECSWCVWA